MSRSESENNRAPGGAITGFGRGVLGDTAFIAEQELAAAIAQALAAGASVEQFPPAAVAAIRARLEGEADVIRGLPADPSLNRPGPGVPR